MAFSFSRAFFLSSLFVSLPASGAESLPSYTDVNSVQALQALQKITSRNPETIPEAERPEWARARLAWVSLLRLEGKEADALDVLAGCRHFCQKWGPEKEWSAAWRWGCRQSKSLKICGNGSVEGGEK